MSMVDDACPICSAPETQCEHWETRKLTDEERAKIRAQQLKDLGHDPEDKE